MRRQYSIRSQPQAPLVVNAAAILDTFGAVFHAVFVASCFPVESNSVRTGWARKPLTPNCESAGPAPRTRTCSVDPVGPEMTNPSISTFAFVPTRARFEKLARRVVAATTAALLVTVPALFVTTTV